MNLFTNFIDLENRLTDLENKLTVTRGEGEDKSGGWD